MNPRDALVKVLNAHRVPMNADTLLEALGAEGVELIAKVPSDRAPAAGTEEQPQA
jgi:hypothetical protein